MTTNHTSYVYVGLAGETAPGRVVKSGLYRMAVGDDTWQLITRGLPEAPAIRAIATHPEQPEIVYVGTQNGPTAVWTRGSIGTNLTFRTTVCPCGRSCSIPAIPRSCTRATRTVRSFAVKMAESAGSSCR